MKKLILAITVVTFTVGAFASDACCDKEKAAAAEKDKTVASPASKDATQCPAGATAKKADKKPTESPKGALARKS